ncbi:MAG: FAD-dependent oxidoreductase, partial [Candidatus Nanopelagicales bacterium]
PWPTYPMTYKVTGAHEEGGQRLFAVSTVGFVPGADGRVSALALVDVTSVDGRFEPVPGSEREIRCDYAFLAMGFTGPEQGPLLDQLAVDLDERGNIRRDEQFQSSVPGVFACGDAGRGQSLIVWAIAEGRSAAAEVDRWLTGCTSLPAPIAPTARSLTV